jgi:hypothetical protein
VTNRKPAGPFLLAVSLFLAAPSLAQVNHGDFLGTSVDFLQVTETTQTVGDPVTLWGAPEIAGTGDQLVFFPPAFVSSCSAGGSDSTSSLLTMDISAQPGGHIQILTLVEDGDVQMTSFPPFGNPSTNATASMSGTLTITETTSGPIAPVVIPWSGTFTPNATFTLPTHFGTKTWNGRVDIDVESVVPLATEAVLAWDNTLVTNCAPGNTSSKIQKKVVNGPVVAIMVNPLECDLEIDKTCCITQPVLPDLDICEGDVVRMIFEFTGDKCSASNNEQGKKFKCYGRRKIEGPADIDVLSYWGASPVVATPNSGILVGDTVELTSTTGTFQDWTKLKVSGSSYTRQYLKMETSCEKALRCGDQFGSLELVGLESTLGGYVDCSAPPPEPTCDVPGDPAGTPCDAKLVDMVLEYNGQDCQNPLANTQDGQATCSGDTTGATNVGIVYTGKFSNKQQTSPASGVNDGDRIRVTATTTGGLFPNQEFKITDAGGVLQSVKFHVSCSQPLALGDEFGPFKLVEWTTKNGTRLVMEDGSDGTLDTCEVPLAPPKPHCTSDLESITMVYIGDFLGAGCTVSNGQSGYASCSGVADPGDPVSVTVGSGLTADPVSDIEFGDLVTITNATPGAELPWLTSLTATGDGGSQSVQFKTSCYKPLSLGDRFGSFVVFGMDREDEGAIALGGEIQYQYTVTNPNAQTVDNVEVEDDQLGVIVSGESIGAGQTATYVQTATLFGTTTNVATAYGDINGDACDPGVDDVTVDVLVPPQGSFSCSCGSSMSDITMTWNGTEPVDVKIWSGAPGSTLLAYVDNVVPGENVTGSGFTSVSSTWEIFHVTGSPKLGQSTFRLDCWDREMNGVEDCGTDQGNGKYDDPNFINTWILEGMSDDDETLVCSPEIGIPDEECGFGAELVLVLPGLMWLHRKRLRRA